jgi:hypothetical protein
MAIPFEGIITDGVFANWGDAFKATVIDGSTIAIGSGKAWLGKKWIQNDSVYQMQINVSEYASSTEPRTVVVCLDLKVEPYYRFARFGIDEQRNYESYTDMLNYMVDRNTGRNSLPLFAINFAAGDSSIQQSNITNLVGTSWCPYVTAPVQTVTVDDIRSKWDASYNALMKDIVSNAQTKANEAESNFEASFNTWFLTLKNQLNANQAANLQNQITSLTNQLNKLVTTGTVENTVQFYSGGSLVDFTTSANVKITAVTKFANNS